MYDLKWMIQLCDTFNNTDNVTLVEIRDYITLMAILGVKINSFY